MGNIFLNKTSRKKFQNKDENLKKKELSDKKRVTGNRKKQSLICAYKRRLKRWSLPQIDGVRSKKNRGKVGKIQRLQAEREENKGEMAVKECSKNIYDMEY